MSFPKINFKTFSIKKTILPIIFVIFTLCLVIFSKNNLFAAKQGLNLWANSVVPSLFPFFIATELLSHTNIIFYLGNVLNRVMRPLFNVPGEGSFALIMGIISGYPTGAKIVSNFKENNVCTKEECERLISFTNNSGPLFIVGTVGSGLFFNSSIGYLLLFTHILACITVGIIFRFWKKNKNTCFRSNSYIVNTPVTFCNLGEVIALSIKSATNTILLIGGFVVLFSVIISILNTSKFFGLFSFALTPLSCLLDINNFFIESFFTGIIELTNGVQQICSIPSKSLSTSIIIVSFLLGFGGISVLLQVLSICSKSNISIKPYIVGKLLHGLFSALYTFIILSNFSFLNLKI